MRVLNEPEQPFLVHSPGQYVLRAPQSQGRQLPVLEREKVGALFVVDSTALLQDDMRSVDTFLEWASENMATTAASIVERTAQHVA